MKYVKLFEDFETPQDKLIKITYQKVTPESAEDGDFSEQGWYNEEGMSMLPDEYEIEDGETVISKTVKFLKKNGANEPSSNRFHNDVWYTTSDPDKNYHTGENTYYTYHLYGFTPEEQKEIFNQITLEPAKDNKVIIEEGKKEFKINPKYTHFALLKSNNKIVNGWEYKGYDQEELNSNKEHYFWFDIRDLDYTPKDILIWTKKHCERMGIDPFDTKNWNATKID